MSTATTSRITTSAVELESPSLSLAVKMGVVVASTLALEPLFPTGLCFKTSIVEMTL